MATSDTYARLRALANDTSSSESERATARRLMEKHEKAEAEAQVAREKDAAVERESAKRASLAAFGESLRRFRRYF
jgi:hypothetical protein